MLNINLTPGFEPFGPGLPLLRNEMFPSGAEVRLELYPVTIPHLRESDAIRITVRVQSSDCIMKVLILVDALRRVVGDKPIELFMPYFPYARQDREMSAGHPLSAKVMAQLINSCNFSRVTVFDVHSDVVPALLNNVVSISNRKFVEMILKDKENYLLVSPDAGAYKKVFKLGEALSYKGEILTVSKSRNTTTGFMTVNVPEMDMAGRDAYIVDDIGEGCATFMLIAQQLKKRNVGKVYLILSHGIFSGNAEENLKGIDKVYTTDSFSGARFPLIEEIKLCENILI